ncbi:FecR family protein [Teredinibacter haidensis]|uniref:FecR family protein n=1 Tax=Teredinibacter haidensis TaxID=2731755 RepID=UPI000948F9ED|nr:FecR domain-containing protein [Teredinibacter haidensis]
MNQVKKFKSKSAIQQDAAEWIIKIDQRELNGAERRELAEWISINRSHKREFIALARLWGKLDLLKAHTGSKLHKPPPSNRLSISVSKLLPSAIAASIFVAALIFAFIPSDTDTKIGAENIIAQIETMVGEIQTFQLADGSSINLNTASKVDVAYSNKERAIYLLEGEAHFNVTKNTERPFIVYVGKGSITAVGTAFNVKYSKGVTDLVVTEGKVKVANSKTKIEDVKDSSHPPKKINVKKNIVAVIAGQKLRFDDSVVNNIIEVEDEEIERELSWQKGMLSFVDTPLDEVVHEISRYTDLKILIQDPELANLQVGGYFKAGETQAMLDLLKIGFNINVTTTNNNTVLLTKNDNSSAQ